MIMYEITFVKDENRTGRDKITRDQNNYEDTPAGITVSDDSLLEEGYLGTFYPWHRIYKVRVTETND